MKTIVVKLALICTVLFFIGCTDNTETVIDAQTELTPNEKKLEDKLGLSYTDPNNNGTIDDEDEEETGNE